MAKEKIDYLNRDEIIDKISEIIKTVNSDENNRSFAIDGKWGIGKTFVVDKIDEKFANEKDYIVFKYNAWANDYYEEPLVAIIATMIDQLNDYYDNTFSGTMKQVFRDTSKSLLEIAKSLCKSSAIILGKDKFVEIAKETKNCFGKVKKTVERRMIDNDIDTYKSLKKILEQVRKCMSKLNKKIIFVVDEIDRCLPDYAVKVLERTHHLFEEMKGSVTIYSMDKSQLSGLIKTYYGDRFSIDSYLQKFIEFSLTLGEGELNEKCVDLFENYLKNFTINDDNEKKELVELFMLMSKDIDMRQRIRIINRLNLIHTLFVKDKCHLSVCYYEIFYIIFFDYYNEQTAAMEKNYFTPKGGVSLSDKKLTKMFQSIFNGIDLHEVGEIGVNLDTIQISSMNEYKKLLFFYLKYGQHRKEKPLSLLNEQYSKINDQVHNNEKYIDEFLKGVKYIK